MDDIDLKRELIKTAYDSQSWADKVDKMSPAQVVAVYIRLKSEGKIG